MRLVGNRATERREVRAQGLVAKGMMRLVFEKFEVIVVAPVLQSSRQKWESGTPQRD